MNKRLALLLSTRKSYNDLGLLVLRIVVGTTLCIKHGWEKAFDFHTMATNTTLPFPNLFHLGTVLTLVIALISDFICSILIVLGLGTRIATVFALANIAVAWALVHHFSFFGPRADHGEIIVLFLGAIISIFLAGPGRYSIDYLLVDRKCKEGASSRFAGTHGERSSIDDRYEPRVL
jgi:putative oxidoreductase